MTKRVLFVCLGNICRSPAGEAVNYLDERWPRNVPDPYCGEVEGFSEVLDILEEGCPLIPQTLAGESCEYFS